jgi:hypothetical protein
MKTNTFLTNPAVITAALLECLVMPNGEILCAGTSIGFIPRFGRYLRHIDPRYDHDANTPPHLRT